MMYATLAVQAAVIAFMLLLSEPALITEESQRDAQRVEKSHVPAEPTTLRCRLYFGCVHD
jgi:hypothetical protein